MGLDKRRYWWVENTGSLKEIHLRESEFSSASLSDNDLEIEVRAIGLNFADIFAIAGLYSATPNEPFTPGLEISGVVKRIGREVTSFKPGDRVMAATRFGAYTDRIILPASQCARLPDDWSHEEGASFLIQALTAWYALFELGNLKTGQNVLVHSAAGGVGLMALKMIKSFGACPIGTVSHSDKADWLKSQGFEKIVLRDKEFKHRLTEQLGGRALNLVLDAIGGSIQKVSFDALAPMGRLVTFGAAQYTPGKKRNHWLKAAWFYLTRPKYDALAMISDNKSVMGFNLIWLWQEQELLEFILQQTLAMNLSKPHVGGSFAFESLPDALELLRSGKSMGKVVVTI
ncbi:zinc-binding dehydrogenase [Pleionea sediminis]|uniref:zinc-binding dehydrogenase n=1 Tax=Pleionea sediminis TaxID=2569479 RepID=UPI00118713B0|nr:zinc-binding dehydrogenase [Pleionea sediminis]